MWALKPIKGLEGLKLGHDITLCWILPRLLEIATLPLKMSLSTLYPLHTMENDQIPLYFLRVPPSQSLLGPHIAICYHI